ncbi:MAG: hypothetical protein LM573_07255 [Thermofilum sp.]|nr:hypothetical protein [Thermofilum sp.]
MFEDEFKYMKKGEKEARIGLRSEEEIIDLINKDDKFRKELRECLIRLDFDVKGVIHASKEYSKKDKKKTDIVIKIDDELGISVKTCTETSFHQLDRRRLEDWQSKLSMPNEIYEVLKEAILRVSRNPNNTFILENDRENIRKFFNDNLKTVLNEIFTKGDEKLKLLLINDKTARKIYIFRMDEALEFLYNNAHNNVSFTKKGIIKLGDYITVQRKGGDGKRVNIPKTDWKHPGNQLQFKFHPLEFVKGCKELKKKEKGYIRFCELTY